MTEQRISEGQFRRFLKTAETVKEAISLADYCRDRGVALKPVGRSLAGLCPIHSEKSASFNVYPNQRFKCYGCQATGDVLELHQRLEGLPQLLNYCLRGLSVGLKAREQLELEERLAELETALERQKEGSSYLSRSFP